MAKTVGAKGASLYGVHPGGLAKKDRITHRIALASAGEIDAEGKKWLNTVYDLDRG